MSGLKTRLATLTLLALSIGSARAQGVVPGGWSTQFGYQPLGGSHFSSGPGYGAEMAGFGGVGYGFGSYPTTVGTANAFGQPTLPITSAIPQTGPAHSNFPGLSPGMPQTSISADPLMGAISKTVRRSKRR